MSDATSVGGARGRRWLILGVIGLAQPGPGFRAELGNLRGDDHGRWMHWCPLGFDLADSIACASSSPFGRLYGR
jgi:hypothetical protein